MKAIVTGSAGFVGRHLTRALRERGWSVFEADVAHPLPSCRLDARDVFGTIDYRSTIDAVFHAAAVVGGRATIDGSPLDLAIDFELDAALARWAAAVRPGRVVYFSSSAAYPKALQAPGKALRLQEPDIDPDDAAEPDALYGWIKLTGERLMARLRDSGVPVTVVRPFSGYGEDQALDYPFPSFIGRAVERVDPFPIWGPGTQVRDWVHIDDVVEAVLAMVEGEVDGPLNIGTGIPTSFFTLANMVSTAVGYRPELVPMPDAPTGVHYRVADVERLRKVYVPKVTLEEGIERALRSR